MSGALPADPPGRRIWRGGNGRIVNVASTDGSYRDASVSIADLSKQAVEPAMPPACRLGSGRVTALCPGAVDPDARRCRRRPAVAEDVAEIVSLLLHLPNASVASSSSTPGSNRRFRSPMRAGGGSVPPLQPAE
jgi:NAD(P)-dependent dehydrogenase (short-subunit alcohol dehydrogenase family)